MSIDSFLSRGILQEEPSSKQEIGDLIKIVERDYIDSGKEEITLDWQFGIAYNAALKLATILVRSSGYRVKGRGHHMNIIALIPEFLGKKYKDDADYLDSCRKKRNIVEYDCVGGVSNNDVVELREFVVEFKDSVIEWLSKNAPDFFRG